MSFNRDGGGGGGDPSGVRIIQVKEAIWARLGLSFLGDRRQLFKRWIMQQEGILHAHA